MLLTIMAAMDQARLIGCPSGLPWKLPADLKKFRAYTWGKPIIMGRRTFDLVGTLPGRPTIVLTRRMDLPSDGILVAHSMDEALQVARGIQPERDAEAVVVGGADVYRQALPIADRLLLTVVEGKFEGDAWFPEIGLEWELIELHARAKDERNQYDMTYQTLRRAVSLPITDRQSLPPSITHDTRCLTAKIVAECG